MRIDITPSIAAFVLSAFLCSSAMAQAAKSHDGHKDKHGGQIFHRFVLEGEAGQSQRGHSISSWDLDGWVGTDENKLWLKSEGEREDGTSEQAEFWALYSRNVSQFWDVQAGLRHDTRPQGTTYLTFGVNGLAPYFFETEAHVFISDEGDVLARLRQENDLLLTQRLILAPYIEVNLSAQDIPEQELGAGITNFELGLQTRYEFSRKFAPYVDLRYEQKLGETSSIAKRNGEGNHDFIASVGVRLMF